ncbi:MAG: hypothetical protein HOF74_09055 [Gammaproteobacteria bacterium]|nr:hypothetical protein [Gammaproteobacteria bacterium]MBT3859964.1 hypothetical protein [Gammaproteobacteria bacterium]MBT3986426.1 hypothetical protein [Gammaproteobacteria bacterium]MBT4254824.1 hypothetical protein [Gammaproteobacteria bacterium]MBT4582986.1 hypothetical protein [Gammaproteobacteria bacterium]
MFQAQESASLPVYALGGLNRQELEQAWNCGGYGIAGISAFLGR